ncbi:hypothetical protein EV383_4459 [Pseudonocardia sediminis]|uniref:Uncharacterized protein n=1 Tax=Pseudonocardia sediminis TaxID=1397368 RepID=A0A4Q7V229_PSEST|nr:hypothetical protein EV383_4459 [Pseudonocardia sediminis]
MNEREVVEPDHGGMATAAVEDTDVVWIEADGWSVAHAIGGAYTTWIKARRTRCGRRIPPGRDPAGEVRHCQRCETATPAYQS